MVPPTIEPVEIGCDSPAALQPSSVALPQGSLSLTPAVSSTQEVGSVNRIVPVPVSPSAYAPIRTR